ncbi:monofunctional biosynthetic peptidoglycan transglycosylase [Aquiflexum gelatinilyticum]|uniref:monofunctional biosynthetic peptidoglycan transglycosylase n=1 Tax=Aquiflexum gelatinilyticum TaxID=2961943 RepID=UPI002167C04D|nr:monofunctional biosynthetic peptidoglycan transglycosylase [Aquiflexum gelatinilyticum]MCS4435725.1 monofunctional biosynthetic peptidoglycan transglycosylase [Aquiflexum gelatinilyticum]
MKFIKKIFRFIFKIALWFFIISIGLTLIYRFIPVPVTPLMVIRLWEQAWDEKKDVRLYKDWVSIDNISKHMPQAVYAAEDQKFLEHNGFDWKAMEEAWEKNKKGKRIKGASTISQQTAKNVFLWPSRNLVRKGLEAYFTFLIELIWSKERIMEVYLNVIEMGPGIYGIEAASQTFYNRPASKLTRQQAAMIAAVLPNPIRWSPAKPTGYIRGRQSWILRQMNNLAPIGFGS